MSTSWLVHELTSPRLWQTASWFVGELSSNQSDVTTKWFVSESSGKGSKSTVQVFHKKLVTLKLNRTTWGLLLSMPPQILHKINTNTVLQLTPSSECSNCKLAASMWPPQNSSKTKNNTPSRQLASLSVPHQNPLYDFLLNRLRIDMDISIKISVSQSIIIANSAKNIRHLTRVHSRSGKQQGLFTLCYCLTFQTAGSRTNLRH